MQSIRKPLLFLCSLGLMASAAIPAFASTPVYVAQASSPCNVRVTGTISRVLGQNDFALLTSRFGSIHVVDNRADIDTHGLAIRAGMFAAVSGCFANRGTLVARQVTLASSESAFDRYAAPVSAAIGPCHETVFGTILSVNGNAVRVGVLHTQETLPVDIRGADIHANGLTLRPGVFAALSGCFERNESILKAHEVRLAPSAQAYGALRMPESIDGTIDEISAGRLGLRTRYAGHIHVLTQQTGFRIGERVDVRGTYDPITGVLVANSITAD